MQFSGMNNELTWDAIAHARKLHCVYPSSLPLPFSIIGLNDPLSIGL